MRPIFKKLAMAGALALTPLLAACPGDVSIQSANTVAAKTVIASNQFYTSASKAGQALVMEGLLDKDTFKKADAKAYAILMDVRAGRATFAMLVAATAPLTGAK